MHLDGHGVPIDLEKYKECYREAIAIYQDDVYKDDVFAFISLGNIFYFGNGVEVDNQRAMEYYKKAADLGSPYGMHMLGVMLSEGRGIQADYEMAMKYYEDAAAKGYIPAIYSIAACIIVEKGNQKSC